MFTTTDCSCHNLTILRTLLSKPIVLSQKYLQDIYGLLIVFYKWLTEQDRECEWNQGEGWVSTRCVKRVVFHRWMMDDVLSVYIVEGCQSFKIQKNDPFWSPPWKTPITALTSSSKCSKWKVSEGVAKPRHYGIITSKMEDYCCWESFVPDFIRFCHLWN